MFQFLSKACEEKWKFQELETKQSYPNLCHGNHSNYLYRIPIKRLIVDILRFMIGKFILSSTKADIMEPRNAEKIVVFELCRKLDIYLHRTFN